MTRIRHPRPGERPVEDSSRPARAVNKARTPQRLGTETTTFILPHLFLAPLPPPPSSPSSVPRPCSSDSLRAALAPCPQPPSRHAASPPRQDRRNRFHRPRTHHHRTPPLRLSLPKGRHRSLSVRPLMTAPICRPLQRIRSEKLWRWGEGTGCCVTHHGQRSIRRKQGYVLHRSVKKTRLLICADIYAVRGMQEMEVAREDEHVFCARITLPSPLD